jgi:hypothetical protein
MSQILRQLKIYHLTDLDTSDISYLDEWLSYTFKNLIITKQEDGNLLYSRESDNEVIFVLDVKDKIIGFNSNTVNVELIKRYKTPRHRFDDIIQYICIKYYDIKCNDIWDQGASRIWNMFHKYSIRYINQNGDVSFKIHNK